MAGSQSGSQGSPGGKVCTHYAKTSYNTANTTKGYGKDSLRPVTIKQLIEAQQPNPDGEFLIDGSEITQVTFVGQIRSMAQQATNTTYKLDDGTGIIEVKQWFDADAPPNPNHAGLQENAWCRVFGRMKSFNGKRHVGSHFIRPITDYNEVSCHLLEATYVHCYYTRGPPEQLQAGGGGGDSLFVAQDGGGGAAPAAGGRSMAGLSAGSRKVLTFLNNSPNNNEGTNVHNIAKSLGININEVFKAGDELLGQGIIYTTVDDETWAVLEQ